MSHAGWLKSTPRVLFGSQKTLSTQFSVVDYPSKLGIPFADLSPIVARIWGISRDGAVSRRRDGDGLFGEPMEEQAARP